jgi:hypothetical protein
MHQVEQFDEENPSTVNVFANFELERQDNVSTAYGA